MSVYCLSVFAVRNYTRAGYIKLHMITWLRFLSTSLNVNLHIVTVLKWNHWRAELRQTCPHVFFISFNVFFIFWIFWKREHIHFFNITKQFLCLYILLSLYQFRFTSTCFLCTIVVILLWRDAGSCVFILTRKSKPVNLTSLSRSAAFPQPRLCCQS